MLNKSNYLEETKYSKKLKMGVFYIFIFLVWLMSVLLTRKLLVFGFGALMAGVTYITSYLIPNDRDVTLSSFRWTMLGYSGFVIMMHIVLLLSYNDALAGTDTGTTYGFANNIFSFSTLLIPLGFVGWQLKKFTVFYGGKHSKKKTTEYLKRHGNDGRH